MADGNSPLKILLLLVGSKGLAAHPPAVVEILSLVSRVSLEILVRRRDLGVEGPTVCCFDSFDLSIFWLISDAHMVRMVMFTESKNVLDCV